MFYQQPAPAPLHLVQPSTQNTPGTRSTKCWVNVLPPPLPLCSWCNPQLTLYGLSSSLWQHKSLSSSTLAGSQQKETVHRSAAAEQLSRKLLGLIVPPLMHHCTGHTASVFNCNRDYPDLPCARHMCIVHVHIVQHFLRQAMAGPMA